MGIMKNYPFKRKLAATLPNLRCNNNSSSFSVRSSSLQLILAGIIMHLPGLTVKWMHEDWNEYIQSLIGAAIEGVFLLVVANVAMVEVYVFVHYAYIMMGATTENSKQQQREESSLPTRIKLPCIAVSSLMGSVYASFIVTSIVGDASFRVISGNDRPDAETLHHGYQNARQYILSQFQAAPLETMWRTFFGFICLGASVCMCQWPLRLRTGEEPKEQGHGTSGQHSPIGPSSSITRRMAICFGIVTYFLDAGEEGWYQPVVHAYISIFATTASDSSLEERNANNNEGGRVVKNKKIDNSFPAHDGRRPNVIYILHESLSGSIMLNTDKGIKAMPFFQNMMHNDTNMFVFENARTVSGSTIDCIPALLTGCLPYNDEGYELIQEPGRGISYSFAQAGYATASFSSSTIDKRVISGAYKVMFDLLVGGFDYIVDPIRNGLKQVNGPGCDDREMLSLFEEWLHTKEVGANAEETTPFYAQFYTFNTHLPYLKDGIGRSLYGHRYYDSLETTDKFLKGLFSILERTGELDNTILVGTSDHGDDQFKGEYFRLAALNSNVLHAASYIYYPQQLMPDDGRIAEYLKRNTRQLVHTLDFYPTIQSFLRGGYDSLTNAGHGCITGVDLSTATIPDDRVVISSNSISRHNDWKHLWGISTKNATLYHRRWKSVFQSIDQGKDDIYVLEYGKCTRSTSNLCMHHPIQKDYEYFREAVDWINRTTLLGDGVKSSAVLEFFAEKVLNETLATDADVAIVPQKWK